jgi:hypothetical protein
MVEAAVAVLPGARAGRLTRERRGFSIATYVVLLAAVCVLALSVAQVALASRTEVQPGIPELVKNR